MKNTKSTATPKELLAELKALVGDAEQMISGSAGDATEGALDSLRSRYEAMQEQLADVYEGAKKKIVAGAKYTDTTIRENPYQSMAVAAGVGLVVGLLLGRRGSK